MSKRKPRYSREFILDFFSSMHGNTKPCGDGECPITVAMGDRLNMVDAADLDLALVRAIDNYTETVGSSRTSWERLSAAAIVRITRQVMAGAM